MSVNNKDLYQVLKIDKNASQQQIIKVSQSLIPKNLSGSVQISQEVGEAIMVLTDPQKKIEYDNYGWKDEWSSEWEKEVAFRNSIFEAIISKLHINTELCYYADGGRIYIGPEDLDSSLWSPSTGWINKIFDTRGANWKARLEDFKNKMLAAIEKVRQEKQKTVESNCWEYAEGNCAKCGKIAKLRRKTQYSDGKEYCSSECYYNNWDARYKKEVPEYKYKTPEYKSPNFDYICVECHQKGKFIGDVYEMENGRYYHKSCFNKYLEGLKNPDRKDNKKDDNPAPNPDDNKNDKTPEQPESDPIKRLEKDIKHYKGKKKDVSEKEKQGVQELIDKLERELKAKKLEKFLVEKKGVTWSAEYNRFTGKTTRKEVKRNPLLEILEWMKKEGITNISLNSQGKLVVEYGNLTETVEDNNLTTEQKEIKEFFQQNPTLSQSLNQNELEKEVKAREGTNPKDGDKNKWIIPATIISLGAVILVLIGVIIYKSRDKKSY